jgi:hypothetical protein
MYIECSALLELQRRPSSSPLKLSPSSRWRGTEQHGFEFIGSEQSQRARIGAVKPAVQAG